MKQNISTCVLGQKVLLVPYRSHHVPKYNNWMSNKEIQELTSSEPLSLDEEYAMQKSWQQDEDKLTFIILRRDLYDSYPAEMTPEDKEITSMIGDVNIFLHRDEDGPTDGPKCLAELEIMIVDKENRCNGFGSESVQLMMSYAMQGLDHVKRFFVKIDEGNVASIGMFLKLGFEKYEYVKAFKQVSLGIDASAVKSQTLDINCEYLCDKI